MKMAVTFAPIPLPMKLALKKVVIPMAVPALMAAKVIIPYSINKSTLR